MAKTKQKKQTSAEKMRERILKRVDKKRQIKMGEFVAKLEDTPIIQVAAAQTGIHRSTYYRWYEEYPDFKDKADKALEAGVHFVNDMMESMLIKHAKEGKITPIIFWLKHHHKQYMEMRRYEHFHRHKFEKEETITEEQKEAIGRALEAWSSYDAEDENERDEDYEIPLDDPSRM